MSRCPSGFSLSNNKLMKVPIIESQNQHWIEIRNFLDLWWSAFAMLTYKLNIQILCICDDYSMYLNNVIYTYIDGEKKNGLTNKVWTISILRKTQNINNQSLPDYLEI